MIQVGQYDPAGDTSTQTATQKNALLTNPVVPPTPPAPVNPATAQNSGIVGPNNPTGAILAPNSSPDQNPSTSGPAPIAYDSNGNPVYTPPPASTPAPTTPSLAQQQSDYQSQVKSFSDQLTGIQNGSTPLSAGEQAQIDALKNQFEQAISTQRLVNTSNEGSAQIRGFQTGAAEFDRSFQANTIGSIVSAGATKITNLQTQEASALAQLTQSLKNNDITNIKSAYDMYTSAHADVAASITQTVKDAQQALKDNSIVNVMANGIVDPKQILSELSKQGYSDITSTDVANAIKNLSPDRQAIITQAQQAANNGASSETIQSILAAPDAATALAIAAQGNVANSAVMTLASKYPDAGIVAGDSIEQANAKVQRSASYTLTQKAAAADIAYKQAQTKQLIDSTSGGGGGNNYTPVTMTGDNTPNQAQQSSFLAALPTDLATLVKGIANYQINPSSVPTRNYKGVGGLNQSQVLTLVSEYDPSFSQQNYSSRQSLLTNFTSGKYSQNINALNTAVGHISDVLGNFSGLGNTNITPYNSLKNEVANIFGSGAIKQASLNINAATAELATVFKGSGATDQEIKSLGTLDANSSPDQVKAYIETASQLLASRLQALQDTYTSGMGKAPTNSFLSTTSQQQLLDLQKKGLNIQVPQLAQSPFVQIQTFHDASPANATLLDGIMANHPEFQSNPQSAIDYLNQQGIQL